MKRSLAPFLHLLAAGPLAAQAAGSGHAAASPGPVLSGLVYAQYGYQASDTAHQNAFAVTRSYVNLMQRFPSGLATRLTADLYSTSGSLALRLKYAYAAYTPPHSALSYKFGLIHTPWVDFEEALWDYRMQGPVALDRNGYLTSADLGAGVDGSWQHERLNLQLALVNGEGYAGGLGDRRKDLQARISLRLLPTDDRSRVGGLRVSAYGGIGAPTSGGRRQRWLGMVSYRSRQVTGALEVASLRDSVAGGPGVPPKPAASGRLLTGFGVVNLGRSGLAAIGRLDLLDPDSRTASDRQSRLIAGLSYQATPELRVLADLDRVFSEVSAGPAQRAAQTNLLLQLQFTF